MRLGYSFGFRGSTVPSCPVRRLSALCDNWRLTISVRVRLACGKNSARTPLTYKEASRRGKVRKSLGSMKLPLPFHGLESNRMARSDSHFDPSGPRSVYAALERLQGKGLVSSHLGEPTAARGGRAKRYFRATSQGLREARETRNALMNLWRAIRELQGEPT